MKARIPNRENKNKKSNSALTSDGTLDPNRPFEIIKKDINTVFEELIQTLDEKDLGLNDINVENMNDFSIKTTKIINLSYIFYQNINQFKISPNLYNISRKYVLELLNKKLLEALEANYSLPENNDNSSKLNMLLDIMEDDYQNSITNSKLPDPIKSKIIATYTEFTEKKLEELNVSKTEFERLLHPNNPENEKNTVSDTEEIDDSNSFYNQVKNYTNNFQFLIVPEYMHIKKHPYGKFENYDYYLKYDNFQKKFKEYILKKRITELEAIDKILSSNDEKFKNELLKIDKAFIPILQSRKISILEKSKNKNEPEEK